ncbi:MAG: type II toxin-antitoxin system ParD family antitoxin [Myxococcales bacterium]|nr:type II toxin-antitoxin system ParD family antitoxin [Myxococcales bacterium]
MTLNLPPDLEQLIAEKVSDGTYGSELDVVRAALGLLVEREQSRDTRSSELRAWAAAGFADLDAGRVAAITVDDVLQTARRRFLG